MIEELAEAISRDYPMPTREQWEKNRERSHIRLNKRYHERHCTNGCWYCKTFLKSNVPAMTQVEAPTAHEASFEAVPHDPDNVVHESFSNGTEAS